MKSKAIFPSYSEFLAANFINNNLCLKITFNASQSNGEPDFTISNNEKIVGFVEVTEFCDERYRRHCSYIVKNDEGFIQRQKAYQNWIIDPCSTNINLKDIDHQLASLEKHPNYKFGDAICTTIYQDDLEEVLMPLRESGILNATPYDVRSGGQDCHMVQLAARGGKLDLSETAKKIQDIINKKAESKKNLTGSRRILVIVFDKFAPPNHSIVANRVNEVKDLKGFSEVFLLLGRAHLNYEAVPVTAIRK